MKKYKKVYIEITNKCNLSCDFCIQNKRELKNISIEEFKIVLEKLKQVTNYLYFHILGEPLIHPNINELIDIASKDFNINITTNGYLINRIKDNKNIRQINISLHSFDDKYNISLDKYLENIFNSIDNLLKNNTYVSLRLWVKTKYKDKIINYINKEYNCNIDITKNSYKIKNQ
jgi:MoaA/NifB/PqqE/SkfB family radical SAM enzyme